MKYDLPITNTVPTKQKIFYNTKKGDEIKGFFINSVRFGRECAELCQLMNIVADNVTIDRSWDQNKWGFGDYYDARGGIWDFRIMFKNLEEAMLSNKKYDILFISCVNGFSEFSQETQDAILKRVENGAGLILLQPFDGKEQKKSDVLEKLSPLKALYQEGYSAKGYADIAFDQMRSSPWKANKHYITNGIPFELFPWQKLAYYPYESDGEVIISGADNIPIAAVKQVGKGRVAAFGYYKRDLLPQHAEFTGNDACFNPITDSWHGVNTDKDYTFIEYFYKMIGRAALWCTNKNNDDLITKCNVCDGKLFSNSKHELYAEIKNAYNEIVLQRTKFINNEIILPKACDYGGLFIADISSETKDKTMDFATHFWETPCCAEISQLKINDTVLKNGDTLTAEFNIYGNVSNFIAELFDGYGRLLQKKDIAVKQGNNQEVSFELNNVISINVFVLISVCVDGIVVLKNKSPNCVITPQKRNLNDFEVFMNPQNRGWTDLLPYINELYPQMGMTGSFIGDNRLTAMSGGEGLGIYWYNRANYVANKEKYLETHDIKYLKRTPCLNDENFWMQNNKKIKENVSINKKYGPIAYFAQDEGSLTCYTDEFDLCFCDNCMQKFRIWLKEQYKTLEALNIAWQTNYNSYDEVVPMTLIQARKANNYASWADHRTFMELTYANGYKNFSEMIKEVDPEGRVRMSGCQSSTAFSGNDYELLHRYVKYFEAYPGGNQYEFHRSFKKDDTILGGWFGYGASGCSVKKRIWHAMYHGLTLISIFWEYACFNHDFSFSQSAKDMCEAFTEIRREGIGKLLLHCANQNNLGVAVHYSMPSVHGTTAIGQRIKFEENRQGWLDLLEDMGYQYSFISNRQIENGSLNGYKMLILPYSIAVSDSEAKAIVEFVKAGGVVVGDIQTGIMNEHCVQSDHGVLDNLFGIKRLTTDCEYFYVCEGFTVNPEFKFFDYQLKHTPGKEEMGSGVEFAEVGTRANEGIAAYVDGFSGKVASCIVNECGSGKAIYLNFSLNNYPKQRKSTSGGSGVRNILRNVFNLSQVEKPAQLLTKDGKPMEKCVESFYYSLGSGDIVCIQRELNEDVELNYDGLTINRGSDKPLEVNEIVLKLNKKAHVYNVRKKIYLGFIDTVEDNLCESDSNIYAFLTYKSEKMNIICPKKTVAEAPVKLHAKLDASGVINECIFAINVYDPHGSFAPLYSQNVLALGGKAEIEIPFAFNDTKGTWKITVKDVASGTMGEFGIDLC